MLHGYVQILISLCLSCLEHVPAVDRLGRPDCANVRILNGSGWTSDDLEKILLQSEETSVPVLITDLISWWRKGVAGKEFILESFGEHALDIATDLSRQSATGFKGRDRVRTTVGNFIRRLDEPNATRYTFTWLHYYLDALFNQKWMDTYPIPEALRRHVYSNFFTMGSYSAGIRLHSHQPSWVALLAGRKRWFLAPPHVFLPQEDAGGLIQTQYYSEDQLASSSVMQSCVQHESEVLMLPNKMVHATFDLDKWTVGIGSQFKELSEGRPHFTSAVEYAAYVGNMTAFTSLQHELSGSDIQDGLNAALISGHVPVSSFLLEHGGVTSGFPLVHAFQNGHKGIVALLLQHGACPESSQEFEDIYDTNGVDFEQEEKLSEMLNEHCI